MNILEKIPKVELHLHLDGSVRINTLSELSNKNIKTIYNEAVAKEKCLDLNDYLTKFELPIKVMQTKENLERIAYELATDLKNDSVIYAEVRFAPLKHINNGLSPNEVIDSVLKGIQKVNDISINLILCMMRDMSYEDNIKVIELAKEYKEKGVVAIDLAGNEKKYKTSSFTSLFRYAKENNIPFTIHAGEADGESSIKAAIDFGAKRLGHGIKIIEYDNLITDIKNKNILLEICPTSNIQTNAILSYQTHPLEKLYNKGCLVSINTDNRTVSNITLSKEYENIINNSNLKIKDLIKMNKMAITASFANKDTKEKILKIINDYEASINK